MNARKANPMLRVALSVGTAGFASIVGPPAAGVIPLGNRLTVVASDFLAGGDAEYVGRWGAYTGTPISPRHFATATHIGNAGGGVFFYRNGTATETQYSVTLAGTQSDLAIYRLNDDQPSFTRWAPIYTRSNEPGKPMAVVGRGADKGSLLTVGGEPIGWFWGTQDNVFTRGTNTVDRVATFGSPPSFAGQYLVFSFDEGQGDTEAIAAVGDSSGPVFIVDPADGVKKLAALISAVDGGYSGTPNGPQISGAFYDVRGLYFGPTLITGPEPIPVSAYALRLSARLQFLRQTAGVPPLACPSDQNGDRVINTADLTQLLSRFGQSVIPGSTGDVDENGQVNTADLTALLAVFGTACP